MTYPEVRLPEVVQLNPRKPAELKARGDTVPFLGMSDVGEDGSYSITERRPVSDVLKGYTYFGKGDVLLAKITPCMENGKAAFLGDLPADVGFGSTEFHVLRPGPRIDGRYLFYLLWRPSFRSVAGRNMTGSAGQKRVPTHFLERLPVPLPPLPEQRRIAAILDNADAIRRKRRQAIELTEELLRSTFLEMFGDPVTNPKGWPKTTFGELVPRKGEIVDGPFGSSLKPELYVDSGVTVVRNRNIFDDWFDDSEFKYVTEQTFHDLRRSEVRPGDLVLSTKGTIGSICVLPDLGGPALLSASGTVRIRLPADSPLLAEVVVRQMTQRNYKRYMKWFEAGTNQKYLNLTGIRKMELIVPPRDLQACFANLLLRSRTTVSKLEGAAEQADNLFHSLAQRAFRGEL